MRVPVLVKREYLDRQRYPKDHPYRRPGVVTQRIEGDLYMVWFLETMECQVFRKCNLCRRRRR
jgi:hypothetical protein